MPSGDYEAFPSRCRVFLHDTFCRPRFGPDVIGWSLYAFKTPVTRWLPDFHPNGIKFCSFKVDLAVDNITKWIINGKYEKFKSRRNCKVSQLNLTPMWIRYREESNCSLKSNSHFIFQLIEFPKNWAQAVINTSTIVLQNSVTTSGFVRTS